jgi:hypothetical protein
MSWLGAWRIIDSNQVRQESSFSEEKEAKRLLDALRGRRTAPGMRRPLGARGRVSRQKVFLLLFLQKKKTLPCDDPPQAANNSKEDNAADDR